MSCSRRISTDKRASVDRTDQLPASGLSDVYPSRFANGDQRNEESVGHARCRVLQKLKQEWALHFRGSSDSRSEIRDRSVRNSREN
jgi:hypothetical protein